MNSLRTSPEGDAGNEIQRAPDELVDSDGQEQDLQRILDELATKADDDEDLQRILEELASWVDQEEDLQPVETVLFSRRMRWSGPIPPPELLAEFEAVKQGFADRIVSMAEREQTHQMQMQLAERKDTSRSVTSDIIQTYLGTILGFLFAMAFLGVGTWLIANGHWESGVPLGLLPPSILFGLFAFRYLSIFRRQSPEPETDVEHDR